MISWSFSLSLGSLNHHNNNVIHMFLRLPPPLYWRWVFFHLLVTAEGAREMSWCLLYFYLFIRTFVVRCTTDRASPPHPPISLVTMDVSSSNSSSVGVIKLAEQVVDGGSGDGRKKKLEPWEIFAKMRKHQQEPLPSSSWGSSYLTVLLLLLFCRQSGWFIFILGRSRSLPRATASKPTTSNEDERHTCSSSTSGNVIKLTTLTCCGASR